MESLLIHPQDPGQLEQVKTYLNSLKIAFEVKKSTLPPHVVAVLKKLLPKMTPDKPCPLMNSGRSTF